jgi:hypothetical protein
MYVRGYLQGSENGRVVTIAFNTNAKLQPEVRRGAPIGLESTESAV